MGVGAILYRKLKINKFNNNNSLHPRNVLKPVLSIFFSVCHMCDMHALGFKSLIINTFIFFL